MKEVNMNNKLSRIAQVLCCILVLGVVCVVSGYCVYKNVKASVYKFTEFALVHQDGSIVVPVKNGLYSLEGCVGVVDLSWLKKHVLETGQIKEEVLKSLQ